MSGSGNKWDSKELAKMIADMDDLFAIRGFRNNMLDTLIQRTVQAVAEGLESTPQVFNHFNGMWIRMISYLDGNIENELYSYGISDWDLKAIRELPVHAFAKFNDQYTGRVNMLALTVYAFNPALYSEMIRKLDVPAWEHWRGNLSNRDYLELQYRMEQGENTPDAVERLIERFKEGGHEN